jgi:hypothetical protein
MALDTAADLGTFFNIDDFAKAGTYKPRAGGTYDVTVILTHHQDRAGLFQTDVQVAGLEGLIRQSEIPEPAEGDELEIGASRYSVRSHRKDEAEVLWFLDLDEI